MHTPKKQAQDLSLTVLSDQAEPSHTHKEHQTSFDGGSGPPPPSLMKSPGALWVICTFGIILVTISLFALSNDPATATYRQSSHSFGDVRVFCELLFLVVGTGCIFPLVVSLRALSEARKIEKGSDGRVKSLRTKKLEKISDNGILGIIGNYVAALLGVI